ncbi:MAG: chorismate synthase [Bacillota bacterium]|nr:chorismate synthase [Bacillota bacterium]
MSSTFGKNIKCTIFGQSHSPAIGVVIEGLPPGTEIKPERIREFMARRAPGNAPWVTPRKETDAPEIVSGVFNDKTCGVPLCALIHNTDHRSGDYDKIKDIPRPGHADFSGHIKYRGFEDHRGGGHFSGRLTAPLCFAGAITKDILAEKGIFIGAHIAAIGGIEDKPFDPVNITKEELEMPGKMDFPVQNYKIGDTMTAKIMLAKEKGDSLGGLIEGCAIGLPPGLGEPIFDGLENDLAKAAFGIPAVKGVEFGNGFAAAEKKGSENNDDFIIDNGTIKTATNNHGGILGGITTGMPLIMRIAIKPTPSISQKQRSVDIRNHEETELTIDGRHDPCIVPRAVPVLESIMAITILDHIIERN